MARPVDGAHQVIQSAANQFFRIPLGHDGAIRAHQGKNAPAMRDSNNALRSGPVHHWLAVAKDMALVQIVAKLVEQLFNQIVMESSIFAFSRFGVCFTWTKRTMKITAVDWFDK
ncbi:MAG: hypothetical protein M3O30_09975 [Planctomycetota bacterium]|nr:hypothetical protein [Planctomycetota bacterium]